MLSTPSPRAWLARHPAVGAVIAMTLLLVSFTAIALAMKGPSKTPKGMYYFDLTSGDLFVAPGGQVTPIAVPRSGETTGVRAHVFACASCDNEADRYVGYLTKHNPQTVERIGEQRGGVIDDKFFMMLDLASNNTLYHEADVNGDWLEASSSQAQSLIAAARNRCASVTPTPCVP